MIVEIPAIVTKQKFVNIVADINSTIFQLACTRSLNTDYILNFHI
nr:MAG TPA: hypothetical protein [Caudoviricetes sp.]